MDTQAIRRALSRLLAAACAGVATLAAAQDGASFLDGPSLARHLLQNLVRIDAQDINEHGFGYVVAADARTLWVVTARHVVTRVGMRGSGQPDVPGERLRAMLCGAPSAGTIELRRVDEFDAGGSDTALLVLPRPAGYEPLRRALALQASVEEPVWMLGRDEQCEPVPAAGRVRTTADARSNLRIDFGGVVLGGSSGGAVASARGVIGLMKSADDLTTTVHDIADLRRRVEALSGVRWLLEDARNFPPGEPRSAEMDLTETLRQYQMALRNVHGLLQMTTVARPTIEDYLKRYNEATTRFSDVRDKHNGTLSGHWGAAVLQRWQALASRLWDVHLHFWQINAQMEEIYRSRRTTEAVRARMLGLEPHIQTLESEMAQFMRTLTKETS